MNGFRTALDFDALLDWLTWVIFVLLRGGFTVMCVVNGAHWVLGFAPPKDYWWHRALLDAIFAWVLWQLPARKIHP